MEYGGFYQELLRDVGSYHSLGNRLIQLGEQAHAFRQFDKAKEIGQTLSNLPLKNYQAIGNYFLGVAANNNGNGDQTQARILFELVADIAPEKYKAKAILSLAAVSANTGDYESELYYFYESLKVARNIDIYTILKAQKGIAVIQAREGSHWHSLKYLETFLPLIKYAEPQVYFDYLNSYAVELGEANRKHEARNVSRIILASPLIHAYPEWQETARDLKGPNRSFVAFPFVESKFVKIETSATQPSITETQPEPPTKVLAFPAPDSPSQPLREPPRPNKPKRLKAVELSKMNSSDKREMLLAGIKSGAILESDYNNLLFISGLVESGPPEHVIDLEDAALLNSIIMVWCNLIDAEQFAAVISALRDCKDDLRRKAIMEDMITIAYQQTASHRDSEHEWRLKVECKLPEK